MTGAALVDVMDAAPSSTMADTMATYGRATKVELERYLRAQPRVIGNRDPTP